MTLETSSFGANFNAFFIAGFYAEMVFIVSAFGLLWCHLFIWFPRCQHSLTAARFLKSICDNGKDFPVRNKFLFQKKEAFHFYYQN